MPEKPQRGKPGPKGARLDHDKNSPAYRIVYGIFGGIAEFCRCTGEAQSTVHWWLTSGGIIPDNKDHRHARIIAAAKDHMGVEIDPALFVRTTLPQPAAAA